MSVVPPLPMGRESGVGKPAMFPQLVPPPSAVCEEEVGLVLSVYYCFAWSVCGGSAFCFVLFNLWFWVGFGCDARFWLCRFVVTIREGADLVCLCMCVFNDRGGVVYLSSVRCFV